MPDTHSAGTPDMENQEYLKRIKSKIEKLTATSIQLQLDEENKTQIRVQWGQERVEVVLGSNVLQYPGFARMAIEYAVASINQKREIGQLEFHILLARN